MKVLVIVVSIISLFPGVSLGEIERPDICYSHGECQEKMGVEYRRRCFVVKTGLNEYGRATCALQCHNAPLGSFCRSVKNKIFGVCEKEHYADPVLNPDFPDCSSAIDSPF